MKQLFLLGAAALIVGGCASTEDDYRYSNDYYDRDRYSVSEEHPVIVDRDGHRTYVRERDDYRGSPYYQNNMEPRVRGKHADSLGWNTENYYLQRGY
jgi:hypothetical protein